jgi:hypothetical protein
MPKKIKTKQKQKQKQSVNVVVHVNSHNKRKSRSKSSNKPTGPNPIMINPQYQPSPQPQYINPQQYMPQQQYISPQVSPPSLISNGNLLGGIPGHSRLLNPPPAPTPAPPAHVPSPVHVPSPANVQTHVHTKSLSPPPTPYVAPPTTPHGRIQTQERTTFTRSPFYTTRSTIDSSDPTMGGHFEGLLSPGSPDSLNDSGVAQDYGKLFEAVNRDIMGTPTIAAAGGGVDYMNNPLHGGSLVTKGIKIFGGSLKNDELSPVLPPDQKELAAAAELAADTFNVVHDSDHKLRTKKKYFELIKKDIAHRKYDRDAKARQMDKKSLVALQRAKEGGYRLRSKEV